MRRPAAPNSRCAEREEIVIIEAYLPQQMSEAEMKVAVAALIKETGAAGPKDMGKVMGAMKAKFAGRMDFGKANGRGEGTSDGFPIIRRKIRRRNMNAE